MAEEAKISTPTKTTGGGSSNPESPTTARPLDFDDEPQETGVISSSSGQPIDSDAPPPKPPRPLSPREESENILKEAFPTVEASVVKAVLVASAYNTERAFTALLGMTDPTAQQEDIPPAKPPRPTQPATSTTQKQLQEDELYARQLAEHYSGAPRRGRGNYGESGPRARNYEEEREHSFFDDDLPVIRENIRKGFVETQSKVNAWVQNFKKRLDGEDEVPPSEGYQQGYSEAQTYNRPRRSADSGRRSGDRERYDADPQVLGDDFSALELRDAEAPPPPPARPLANPNLFKPASPSPDRRKVSFQDGPPQTMNENLYDAPDSVKRASGPTGRSSKWQPLSAVEPSPVAEHDPFSLGDSEDEKDAKPKEMTTDEADRVKSATAEAMAEDLGSGSQDKAGEEDKDKK